MACGRPRARRGAVEATNVRGGCVGRRLRLRGGAWGGASRGGEGADDRGVAIDVSGDTETVRSAIDKGYKAQRPPPPEDLPQQVDRCLSILEAIGVPVLGKARYEADDVIAALARTLADQANIRVVSKDKDLKQLLHPVGQSTRGGFELYDVHNDGLITADSLKEEFNVTPEQWRDVLALAGDTADNIKGVEGVGPKTAAKLIGEYGSLANLLERRSEERRVGTECRSRWSPYP